MGNCKLLPKIAADLRVYSYPLKVNYTAKLGGKYLLKHVMVTLEDDFFLLRP